MNRWAVHKLRVRYQETDQMGVVYHANYLTWFEIGRTEYIRELGYPYKATEARGLFLPVVHVQLDYQIPAKYDDDILIYTRMVQFTNTRLEFAYEVRRLQDERQALTEAQGHTFLPVGELLVAGSTKHVWVNERWKPVRLDKHAPDLYAMLQQITV